MSNPKFTPGPWFSEPIIAGWEVGRVSTPGDPTFGEFMRIAEMREDGAEDDNEVEANAHLTAAAPELYDVVASLFDLPDNADGGYICDIWERMQGKAEGALKKARGEQ
ncbi:hypothetical protein R84981_003003 [Carnimonas sp. R-84981]|uniref:hypothetical protein n=1 Tax=Carnimonas bestiolae TaxID=3402172 RepID=UPI003EDBFA28